LDKVYGILKKNKNKKIMTFCVKCWLEPGASLT